MHTTSSGPASSSPTPTTPTERVRAAFRALAEILPDYHRSLYASRAGRDSHNEPNPQAAGSIYPHITPQQLCAVLEIEATWEPFEHPCVGSGCVAFVSRELKGRRTGLEGCVGLVEISTLPSDAEITLADPKGTGFVEACVRGVLGEAVKHTVVILGEEQGREGEPGREIVFTFHPGDPIQPSRVSSQGMVGRVVGPDAAVALGLTLAKIVA